jgi:hypothetical protein
VVFAALPTMESMPHKESPDEKAIYRFELVERDALPGGPSGFGVYDVRPSVAYARKLRGFSRTRRFSVSSSTPVSRNAGTKTLIM